jgi:indoleamine 2,3-dioxygenase
LYNYQRIDPTKPIVYSNLKLIRAFAGTPSEHGFILVHVAMVAHSGNLIKYTMETIEASQDNVNKTLTKT